MSSEVVLAMYVLGESSTRTSVLSDIFYVVFRGIEAVVSFALLVLVAPLLVCCAIAIRLGSTGPAFLSQPRVGQHGRTFNCYKLRTMYVDAPVLPSHKVGASHQTPFGRFLRATAIDELPQLLNVLNGTMRLVGPRPCLPSQQRLIAARVRAGVLHVLPGITGLSQVHNIDMSDEAQIVASDATYARHQSLMMDAVIILQTIGLILGKCTRLFGSR